MNPSSTSPAEQAVRALHMTWIAAVNGGELNRLLTLVTDDVVFINPGGEPADRAGFAKTYADAVSQFNFRCESDLLEVVVAGSVAYTRCRDTLAIAPRAGGATAHFKGYRMTIYRQQADGRWLLARDAHTLTPATNSA